MPFLIALALAAAQQAPPPPVLGPNPDQPPTQTMLVEPVAAMIGAFDTDGDARVTKAECSAGVARSFAGIDTEHKGSIGYIQFSDWAERWLGDRNALPNPFETDTDNDNRITLDELQAKIGRTFDRLDLDHDGILTRAELLTIRAGTGEYRDRRGRRR